MNQRERWLACMRFQPVDHVPDVEFGYWEETFPTWHAQGLPEYVDDNEKADIFFGFETSVNPSINLGLLPPFEDRVIEEDERRQIVIDCEGATKQIYKDGTSTIPHYVKFPIETREDWKEFKKRLDLTTPGRFPSEKEWAKWKQEAESSGKPLRLHCGSLFGVVRNWMGFENIAIACMDDPALVEEMIEHLTELSCLLIEPALKDITFDYGAFWEDIAFNHGPIISPALFKKWLTPRYKRITDLLRSHGCDFAWVDCDGNINGVYQHWLEGGVNTMYPLEVRGGTDPFLMRKRYSREVLLAGGVDKIELAGGKETIDREIERIRPLVEEGGYIPHVDHRCPPDVTYENYLYYLKRKREAFGIPDPPPWEERREQYEWATR